MTKSWRLMRRKFRQEKGRTTAVCVLARCLALEWRPHFAARVQQARAHTNRNALKKPASAAAALGERRRFSAFTRWRRCDCFLLLLLRTRRSPLIVSSFEFCWFLRKSVTDEKKQNFARHFVLDEFDRLTACDCQVFCRLKSHLPER